MAEIIDFEIAKRLHYLRHKCGIWVQVTTEKRGPRKGETAFTCIVGATHEEAYARWKLNGDGPRWETYDGALNHVLWHRRDTARSIEHYEQKVRIA